MTACGTNIGIDLGGTNIKVGLLDEQGNILKQCTLRTCAERGPEQVICSMEEAIETVLRECAAPELQSIGVGVPGTADAETGVVLYAPNLFWRNVAVGERLRARFGVPVYIAQDTRAAAWAEYLVGEARGKRSLASVTLGTGVGCGMVFDGHIFHGGMNTAGEFGHQIVVVDGEPCNCGRRGCLEAHAGGLAILREAKRRIPALSRDSATVDDVYRLALEGHREARKLTEEVVMYVGIGLVNLINLNSVEMICMSGGISNAPNELLLDPLTHFVRAHAYDAVATRVWLRRSSLGQDAPLIGASLLYRAAA